ncbi:MAG: tRNA (guanosine(37)-N1)-methyltransferase TrmD [Chloroherpetonaceae bacterium]|nr:tRNA (guanosine(37)-N1)-methyltransferase TrmD [Chloroherpetonaceae bacterium]MCS7211999.1 tRNA (guanosine(37)-N1)-methyltransferase TrmD [Chloroherpetonaceae bacterium]MDW8019125.1 tRNA (guanosine(37)-N1)-methyltransferase TrmD [Chloroherpetonaceae bacterium]MDW8466930.1 tRNA (guanosine(37)-N1)-methyltransferase TrmD [Chloroherpetonaceae bacterium]
MLRFDVITVMPRYFTSALENGVLRIAQEKQAVQIVLHNLHDYGKGKYQQVDDHPFGGGAGMILMPEPIFRVVQKLKSERHYDEVIFLTPDGERLTQKVANELSLKSNLILLCGHYKGVDERVREALVTREISVGDVVLSGGEIPALMVMDAVARLLPNVLGDAESALLDSFQDGKLDCAHYTRPAEFMGMKVPAVLLSGNHKEIAKWREQNALERTRQRRPDLLEGN